MLGRILERINPGMTYTEVVQARIFAPLGISRPRIGGAHVEDRLPGEVLYHPRGLGVARSVNHADRPWGPSHYGGWNHANMDSHGAWVMAAPDFAKVLAAFDLGFLDFARDVEVEPLVVQSPQSENFLGVLRKPRRRR